MAQGSCDEVFEITTKNYERIAKNLENAGYTEGITDGRNSIFQESFDHGYEDGFKIGFLLGKAQKEKASRGNCGICSEPILMQKPESEAIEKHRKDFEMHENSN